MLTRFIFSVSVLLCFTTHSNAQTQKVEDSILHIMQQQHAVGISVAVVKKGKIIYTHSFGMKDVATGTALTDDCMFRIASISKSFSATSVMQLVEAKKLSLDDDVSKLIGFTVRNPRFPSTVITLRMLLSHRSSLNDSQGYFSLDAINPAKNPNWENCYNDYEPGAGYKYCNLNFNITGTIIERVSGERFDQYVKHHILNPLHIEGGYCVDSLNSARFATIYEYNDSTKQLVAQPAAYNPRREEIANYVMGYSAPIFSPTGGMKISATNLARYMTMHMNKGRYEGVRIMKRKSAKLMQQQISEQEGYGLAIMTTDKLINGVTLKGHTGSAYGLYSAMFFHPKKKYGFVVITNGCYPAYTDGFVTVIKQVVNCLYGELIENQ